MPSEAKARIERICDAIVKVSPRVLEAAERHKHFRETAKRMLHAWNSGMNSLRLQKTWSLPSIEGDLSGAQFSDMEAGSLQRRREKKWAIPPVEQTVTIE